MEKKYFIQNIVNHDSTLKGHSISISGDKIVDIKEGESPGSEESYYYAIPGFIDMHTHGGGGAELMDGTKSALDTISRFYLENGTTSFLASTVTSGIEKTRDVLDNAAGFINANAANANIGRQARLLGIHLEGPWLSKKNLGAQNPAHCIVPDENNMGIIRKYSDIVKMATFSYHTPESEKLLELLVEKNIIPACGHDETYDERILEGFKKGVKVVTHIYCVCSSFQRRHGLKHLGTIEMGLMTEGVNVEVIADGKHITKHFWDFIRHNKKVEDIIIISDSMRCAGLPEDPDKIYKLGAMDVIIDDGVAWLEDKSVFAGSVATMHTNFKRLIQKWGVSINDAVTMTSYNQAKLLNINNEVGEIKPDKTADILLLNENLELCKVIKSGVEV